MTKCAASGPLGTFCHHVVTKHAGVTKRAGCASNFTRFVTLVTKGAVVTKRAAKVVTNRAGIAPFFSHLDISTCDMVSVTCVCVRACVRACIKERERRKERKSERERFD